MNRFVATAAAERPAVMSAAAYFAERKGGVDQAKAAASSAHSSLEVDRANSGGQEAEPEPGPRRQRAPS